MRLKLQTYSCVVLVACSPTRLPVPVPVRYGITSRDAVLPVPVPYGKKVRVPTWKSVTTFRE